MTMRQMTVYLGSLGVVLLCGRLGCGAYRSWPVSPPPETASRFVPDIAATLPVAANPTVTRPEFALLKGRAKTTVQRFVSTAEDRTTYGVIMGPLPSTTITPFAIANIAFPEYGLIGDHGCFVGAVGDMLLTAVGADDGEHFWMAFVERDKATKPHVDQFLQLVKVKSAGVGFQIANADTIEGCERARIALVSSVNRANGR